MWRQTPLTHMFTIEHCGPEVQHAWPVSPHEPPTMPASDGIIMPPASDVAPPRHTPLMQVLPMEHCGPEVQHD